MLGVASLEAGRIEVGIGEAIVHGAHAGGTGIGEPGDLDGGGFADVDQWAAVAHVHGEINEDVDFVGADCVANSSVGEEGNNTPDVGVWLNSCGHLIGLQHGGVNVNLELLVIVMGKKCAGKEGLAMVAKIGGEIADAQGAIGGAVIGKWANFIFERGGELLVPFAVLGEDRIGIVAAELQSKKIIAGREEIGGIKVGGRGGSWRRLRRDGRRGEGRWRNC